MLTASACKHTKNEPEPQKQNAPLEQSDNNPTADTPKHDSDPEKQEKLHADAGHATEFPLPILNNTPVPYVNSETNDSNTGVIYTFVNVKFETQYKQQLKDAGFEEKTDTTFVKITPENKPLIVTWAQGEGEFVLEMLTSRDPRNRYQAIPHPEIPYPLDNDALAAEYAEYQPPNQNTDETVYIYYNKPKSFLDNYEKILREAGFKNVRTPESPLYIKGVENNRELTVMIDRHSAYSPENPYCDFTIKIRNLLLDP